MAPLLRLVAEETRCGYGRGGLMEQMAKRKAEQEPKYTELLDMRTHLTVAILAAAQLKRKSPRADDLARLQDYLDGSLMLLQQDITGLESLVMHLQEEQPSPKPLPRPHRFPPRWVGMGMVFLAAKLRRSFVPPPPQTAHPTA